MSVLLRSFLAGALAIGALSFSASAAAATGSATYSYDDLGRLVSVTYSDGSVISITYDAAGNRTIQVVTR